MTAFFLTSQMNAHLNSFQMNQTVKQLFWNEGFSYINIFFSSLLDSVMYSTRVKRIPLS